MRTRFVCVAATVALLSAIGGAAATAAPQVRIVGSGGARFPDRLFIVSVSGASNLKPSQIQVRENGTVMSGVEIVPAQKARRGDVGVVLAIDTSLSMRGAPIDGAMAAARAFVEERGSDEEVAVLGFNRTATLLQPFTTDDGALLESLARRPHLAQGTHIYDATWRALQLLAKRRVKAGSIVVLSDGSDTGSSVSLRRAAMLAATHHVRLFAVGLRSSAFDPAGLRPLAVLSQGSFVTAATPKDLAPIFGALSSRIAGEYLVHYHSPAAPGKHVAVAVTIANVAATAATVDYTAPALPTKPTRPFYTSFRDKFWRSSGSTVLLGAVAAALMGLAVALLFRGRPKALRARLSEFVSITDLNDKAREGSSLLVSDRAERVLEKTRWWGRFKNDVELAELSMTPVQIVLWTLIATLMCAWLLALIVGTPGAAVLGLLIPFVVRFSILRRVRKKRDAFAEQLPDNLQVLASALRAGHSLVGALAVVVDDAEEPTRSEFRRVIADERLGVPLENALDVVVVRMASRELAQVSLVASLQRRTGSNSAEVLDRVVETIRERAEMRRLVKTLTAQGRASRWIVTALPIFLLVVISAINPHYVAPLFATSGGRIALTVATVMIIAGSYAISRIVDIKV